MAPSMTHLHQPVTAIARKDFVVLRQDLTVQEALSALDDEHRTVVVLRDIQHCDYQEISQILEIPTGTVKSRLNRARLALKEILAPDLELFV
jgi:RNA polymerase sigma factor (sigma-70 family)